MNSKGMNSAVRTCIRDTKAQASTFVDVKENSKAYLFIADMLSLKSVDIKEGDVDTLVPSTDDEVTDMHASETVDSDPAKFYANDDRTEILGSGYMEQNSDEDAEDKEQSASLSEAEDAAAERSFLIAQMKVLDAMLEQVETEERQRAILEVPIGDTNVNGITASYVHVGDGGNFKRRRRPNPKYFDGEVEAGFLAPGGTPSMEFSICGEQVSGKLDVSEGQRSRTAGNTVASSMHATFSSFFDRCSVRSAGTHRTRTALLHKPRVFCTSNISAGGKGAVKSYSYLDNLSIRELHEAYRTTFGRGTSVKDKHWLKRQIFMGTRKPDGTDSGKENNVGSPHLLDGNVKAKLDKESSVEVLLSALESKDVNGTVTGEAELPGNGLPYATFNGKEEANCKLLPHGVLSPSNRSTNGEFSNNIGGAKSSVNPVEVQNSGSPVCGKRLRKPNRRYIEDEGDGGLGGSLSRSILSTFFSAANGARPGALSLSWRSDSEVVGDGYRNCALRSTGIRTSLRSDISHGRRSKIGTNGMKRKNEGRAAKLVKLAHSARAARHDTNGPMCKVKFRLPAAPGQEKGELLNGEDGEQVSCLLPKLTDEASEDHQILSSHYLSRLEETGEQVVVTVPTANGGTRRKHHRPWTLREVVTLVEGVARCGGGKWADIKKLAFSNVGYRTAVDLKDKWRNLLRASRAQLHPPKQGETRKKQISASIPGHILTRVQELAALNNQIIPTATAGFITSRSGRTVHRR